MAAEPAGHIEAARTEVVAVASAVDRKAEEEFAADRKAEEASAAESKTAAEVQTGGFWRTAGLRAFRPATFRRSGILLPLRLFPVRNTDISWSVLPYL